MHIGFLGNDEPKSVHELRRFVDYFFLLRGGHSLDTCELRIGDFSGDEDVPQVNLWFRRAVMCNVRVLKLHIHLNHYDDPYVELDDLPLISKTLTRLDLYDDLAAQTTILDSMPALERAFVGITNQCEDHCIKIRDPSQDCDCESCDNFDSIGDRGNNCVLLKGLSEAVDLVLISNIEK
ncbi:hypothetical protein U9M48_004509, partial [Paspalum notatum var. saurae]